jgi:hypothetical protein
MPSLPACPGFSEFGLTVFFRADAPRPDKSAVLLISGYRCLILQG